MIEVSKDVFYKAVGPENVHPRCERTETIWEIQHTRQRVGRSVPGYVNDRPDGAKRYWLTDDFAARKQVKAS